MKLHLCLIALFFSAIFANEQAPTYHHQMKAYGQSTATPDAQSGTQINMLDALAHNFLYKSDNARRQYVSSLADNERIFQLAFGLKRIGQFDLIRQYFHPNIQMLVLYSANQFYVTVGRQFPSGLLDNLYGFFLTSLRYQDVDIRDSTSTYLTAHAPGWVNKRWKFIPTVSTYGGMTFFMTFTGEEFDGYDNVDQSGWSVAAVRRVEGDKRSSTSTYLNVQQGPGQSNLFSLIPVRGGDCFLVALSRDDLVLDRVDQTGWFMALGEDRPMGADPEDIAKYVVLTKSSNYCWNLAFAM
jgi:hypothetical protein